MATKNSSPSLFSKLKTLFGGDKVSAEEIRQLEEQIKKNPKDLHKRHRLADLYAKGGQIDKAIEAYSTLANDYIDRELYPRAVAVFKQIARLKPERTDFQIRLAELYTKLGRKSDAIALLQTVALNLVSDKKLREATKILQKMLEIEPEYIQLHTKLAEIYLKLSEKDEAITQFKLALQKLKEAKKWKDFLKVGELLLLNSPKELDVLLDISELYLHRGEPKKALKKLQQAFKINSKNPRTLSRLADAFERIGQKQKTIFVLKELGELHRERGEYEKALQVYLRLQQLVGDDPEISQAIQELQKESLEKNKREEKKDDAELYKAIKKIEVQLKYPSLYGKISEQIIQLDEQYPDHPAIKELTAKFLVVQGREEDAAGLYFDLAQTEEDVDKALNYLEELLKLKNISPDTIERAEELKNQLLLGGKPPAVPTTPSSPQLVPPEPPSSRELSSPSLTPPEPPPPPPPPSRPESEGQFPPPPETAGESREIILLDESVSSDDVEYILESGTYEITPTGDSTSSDGIEYAAEPASRADSGVREAGEFTAAAPQEKANMAHTLDVQPFSPPPLGGGTSAPAQPVEEDDPFAKILEKVEEEPPELEEPSDFDFLKGPIVVEKPEEEPDAPSSPSPTDTPSDQEMDELSELEAQAARLAALLEAKEKEKQTEETGQAEETGQIEEAPSSSPPIPPLGERGDLATRDKFKDFPADTSSSRVDNLEMGIDLFQNQPLSESESDGAISAGESPSPSSLTPESAGETPSAQFQNAPDARSGPIFETKPAFNEMAPQEQIFSPPEQLSNKTDNPFQSIPETLGSSNSLEEADTALHSYDSVSESFEIDLEEAELALDRVEDSEEEIEEFTELDVTDSQILETLDVETSAYAEEFEEAYFYFEQEEYEYALNVFRKILEKDPDNRLAKEGEREVLEAIRRQNKKREEEREALLALDLDAALGELQISASSKRRVVEDIQAFTKAVKTSIGEEGETHFELGIAYQSMGLFSQAVEAFEICIKGGYRVLDSYKLIGSCHRSQGNIQEALEAYFKALEQPNVSEEERLDIQFEIALTYEQSGQREDAIKWYKKVASSDPNFRDVGKKLQELGE